MKITELTPSKVAKFVGWLCETDLSDATVRKIIAPLRACLRTTVQEGLIRSNPAREIDLPHRDRIEEDPEEIKAIMSEAELGVLLAVTPERWRLLFTFLASTGLRISEAIALQWKHLRLDGSDPRVKVIRRLVKGRMGPPKSKPSRREVQLDPELVAQLRAHRKGSEWGGRRASCLPPATGRRFIPRTSTTGY
jgi:integrase